MNPSQFAKTELIHSSLKLAVVPVLLAISLIVGLTIARRADDGDRIQGARSEEAVQAPSAAGETPSPRARVAAEALPVASAADLAMLPELGLSRDELARRYRKLSREDLQNEDARLEAIAESRGLYARANRPDVDPNDIHQLGRYLKIVTLLRTIRLEQSVRELERM